MPKGRHMEVTTNEGMLIFCSTCGRILGTREVQRGDPSWTVASDQACDQGAPAYAP
jgi:hypothetical protein